MMKVKMTYLLLLCAVFLHTLPVPLKAAGDKIKENFVKEFYKAYTASFLSEQSAETDFMEKYLTKGLIEKIGRMQRTTGADPVIRAQDFIESARSTFQVTYLDHNWYKLSYTWQDGKSVEIPVRVTQINGQYKIDYITPEWHGSIYGDHLICQEMIPEPVETNSPLSFIKTFYTAYVTEYIRMPEGLQARLATLRNDHFTSNASVQFEEAVTESKGDGLNYYDLLIDAFDFDCLWLPSVEYTQTTPDTWQISYMQGEIPTSVLVTVRKEGETYRMDNIVHN